MLSQKTEEPGSGLLKHAMKCDSCDKIEPEGCLETIELKVKTRRGAVRVRIAAVSVAWM